MDRLFRKFEAANVLQVSETRIRQLIDRGDLKSVTINQGGRATCWVEEGSLKNYSQHRRTAGRPRKHS